jgi:hypothetical protein
VEKIQIKIRNAFGPIFFSISLLVLPQFSSSLGMNQFSKKRILEVIMTFNKIHNSSINLRAFAACVLVRCCGLKGAHLRIDTITINQEDQIG